ncbi:hypothetical protein Ahy_A04g019598 [Arachis hypogaea]|uniref:Protein FAR1-RELATED SEQUENCE n=1 Tax=Arachis hypogaea TaxID=3818 RepID=A0A445DG74_ARAHY|nr:hypothetical protein Ahy_A04g019598 [Arachis hypogaea]
MWVPIFFKGQFWASIRSTQRSDGMHSFFGEFLNCNTSLVQFIHEFDNVLGTMEQKKLEDDAADLRGILYCHYLVVLSSYKVNDLPSFYVIPRWSMNMKRKHTYIKGSHDEFMDCDDEADMLHVTLDDARAKLVDYRARMRNKTITNAHNSITTDTSTVLGIEDIQAHQRKRKSLGKDNRVESTGNQDLDSFTQQIARQGVGGFMSLLNSFDNT